MSKIEHSAQVKELIVAADLATLNAALANAGIGRADIIEVLSMPGTKIGNGGGDRLRVLFWG